MFGVDQYTHLSLPQTPRESTRILTPADETGCGTLKVAWAGRILGCNVEPRRGSPPEAKQRTFETHCLHPRTHAASGANQHAFDSPRADSRAPPSETHDFMGDKGAPACQNRQSESEFRDAFR